MRDVGTPLMVIGLVLVLAGAAARFGLLGWLGNLPGDIRIERESTRIFIPITTSIVLSIVLSLLLALFRR